MIRNQTSFLIEISDSPFQKAMMLRCFIYLREAYAANGYEWNKTAKAVGLSDSKLNRITRVLFDAGMEFVNPHGRRHHVGRKKGGDGNPPPAPGASGPDQPPSG